jgi:transmembrane sensor
MKRRVEQQARAWILRFTPNQSTLTPAEINRFARWVVRHVDVFLEELERYPELDLVNIEGMENILRAAQVFSREKVVPLHPLIPRPWRPREFPPTRRIEGMRHIAVVGIVLAGAALPFGLVGSVAFQQLQRPAISHVVLTTDVGEQRPFSLDDDSTVTLNTNSRVIVDLLAHERRLKLEQGEARFTVGGDERPFHVETQDASIRDIGTTFNVHVSGDGTNVSVLQGRAMVSPTVAPQMSLTLDAGQQGRVTPTGDLLSDSSRPLSRAKDWPQHRMTFRGETADEILNEIVRYYKQPIRIADSRLAQERLTTTLPLDNFAQLSRVLEGHPHIDVTTDADGTLLLHWRP